MRLADIEDPLKVGSLFNYAQAKGYSMMEIEVLDPLPRFVEMIQRCLLYLKSEGCEEFCLYRINQHFDFKSGATSWRVILTGFYYGISKTDQLDFK